MSDEGIKEQIAADDAWNEEQIAVCHRSMEERGEMAAFGASEIACYKWPDDTQEHRTARIAYCEGAEDAVRRRPDLEELKRLIRELEIAVVNAREGGPPRIARNLNAARAALYEALGLT